VNTSSLKITPQPPMRDPKEHEPSRIFSGKLPFRTQPEIHESIFLASKKAGRSINAWMEDILREAAAKKNSDSTSEPVLHTSQSLQTLFQEKPDIVFELIDDIKPALKSNKTRDTIVLMGEIEKLVANYEVVRSEVKQDLKVDTAALIESVLTNTEASDTTKGLMDCVAAIEETISPWLQKSDVEQQLKCTQAIGQVFISVTEIRSCLKDPSLANTLNLLQPVIHNFSSK
jgi:hypothetical protein